MDPEAATQPTAPCKPVRILIACTSCKARKNRCDGGTPRCATCAARDLECEYAAVRKTRGPGKKKKGSDGATKPPDEASNFLFTLRLRNTDGNVTPNNVDAESPSSEGRSTLQSLPSTLSLLTPAGALSTLKDSLPTVSNRNFLLPGVLEQRETMDAEIENVLSGRRQFTPLMPLNILKRVITNTFDDVMAEYRILNLPSLLLLLEEQYAASAVGPVNHDARWALVNAAIALALRNKIAPGAEDELGMYPTAFQRNATTVLPELILQEPTLLSVQALLAMAMFARGVPDTHAFVMLATNALRQLELLMPGWGSLSATLSDGVTDESQLRQVRSVASAFDALLAQQYGLRALLPENDVPRTCLFRC